MGIFDRAYADKLFGTYAGSLTFRDRTAGGTPSDPRMIDAWLRSKAGITSDEERRQVVVRTLRDMKPELFLPGEDGQPAINAETASYDDLVAASTKAAQDKQSNGFKRPDGKHLALETRHLKAMLKEVINIQWAHERWGATRKGPKSFAAERVYVDPSPPTEQDVERYVARAMRRGTPAEQVAAMANAMLALTAPNGTPAYPEFLFMQRPDGSLIAEPDDVETFIGHVVGPKGPQSNLTLVQVVKRATINFTIRVVRDEIAHDYWPLFWVHAQENGLGAMRSQSYGRFDLTRFEPVGGYKFKHDSAWEVDPTQAPTEEQVIEVVKAREAAIAAGVIAAPADNGLVRI